MKFRDAQGREERPELGACSCGEEDMHMFMCIRGISAAPIGLVELGNNQIGRRKGKETR